MAKPQSLDAVPDHATISREEIVARQRDRGLTIVDVMPAAAYRAAHIPGSINLPLEEVESKAAGLLANPAREIAIYCAGPT